MQMVQQSRESANGVTYDAGGTHVGLHVGFFRKPIKIPSVRLRGGRARAGCDDHTYLCMTGSNRLAETAFKALGRG